jgi:hypothetical protein
MAPRVPDIPAPDADLKFTSTGTTGYEDIERSLSELSKTPDRLRRALETSIDTIAAALPSKDGEQSPFTAPAVNLIKDLPGVVNDVAAPFMGSAYRASIGEVGQRISYNYERASEKSLSEKDLEKGRRITPAEYEAESPDDLIWTFLGGTPLRKLFDQRVVIPLPLEKRFRHQWVLGAHGSGKTTLLSAQILADLTRVAKNEASVLVMDSQNELVPQLASLKMFAPGGALHGKLVYLRPDPDHPLSLNIFDIDRQRFKTLSATDRMMAENGALWMVDFFLSSLVKAEASPHQDTFLNYVIPALMAIPDATIFTFKEILEPPPHPKAQPPGYEKYKHHFANLRKDTQDWLRDRMHSSELAVTRNAIRTRLDGFTARGFFHDMFADPRNRLDLFTELQSAKVILINTNKALLKGATEPFGRYFIARLLQATEERMLLPKASRLPVFAYIDEATDYIADEKNIAEMIDKARKQRVGLILAHQRVSHIRSPNVLDALEHVGIKFKCLKPGAAALTVVDEFNDPVNVEVPPVSFHDAPPMSDADFARMEAEMDQRYGAKNPRATDDKTIDAAYRVIEDVKGLPSPADPDHADTRPSPQ